MSPRHDFYLGLGSNIEPVANLARGIAHLNAYGKITAFSDVWESIAVGFPGPNFLNLCIRYEADPGAEKLKATVLLPIEAGLGRVRAGDKNAPRTLDIDILAMDGVPISPERWEYPFVVVPLSQLLPQFAHPLSGLPLADAAREAQATTWIARRPELLEQIRSTESNA